MRREAQAKTGVPSPPERFGKPLPAKTLCRFPSCEAAFPCAKDRPDHEARAHGIENFERLAVRASVGRLSRSIMREKYNDEVRATNLINEIITHPF